MDILGSIIADTWNKEEFSIQYWNIYSVLADYFQLFLFLFADTVKSKVLQSTVYVFDIYFLILNRAVR